MEVSDVHLVKTETPVTTGAGTDGAVRHLLMACGTFASNIVERFHEYADARLADELTIVEQRRRLLKADEQQRPGHARVFVSSTAHVD